MSYRAAVVGLGNIGLGYDYQSQDGSLIFTHAAGFHFHPGFELVAGVDANPEARGRFENKFAQPAFATVREMFASCTPDVVSIAVPTTLHHTVFMEVMNYSPKAVLCEKPVGGNLAMAREMKETADRKGTIMLVNFIRRFEPGVLRLKEAIAAGDYGHIYKGTMWYSKGILNNGSHFIDMLIFLFGPVTAVNLLDTGIQHGKDPEPDVKIRFGDVDIYFLAGREDCFR